MIKLSLALSVSLSNPIIQPNSTSPLSPISNATSPLLQDWPTAPGTYQIGYELWLFIGEYGRRAAAGDRQRLLADLDNIISLVAQSEDGLGIFDSGPFRASILPGRIHLAPVSDIIAALHVFEAFVTRYGAIEIRFSALLVGDEVEQAETQAVLRLNFLL